MKIINCSKISNFNKSTRKYFNINDIRILDVLVYKNDKNDKEMYHKHNKITEILFILDGELEVKIKYNDKKIKVYSGQIIVFYPGESHIVTSLTETTRVLVFKYIKTDNNLLETFINDWESD